MERVYPTASRCSFVAQSPADLRRPPYIVQDIWSCRMQWDFVDRLALSLQREAPAWIGVLRFCDQGSSTSGTS